MIKPRVSILDKRFKWYDPSKTDVTRTWAAARERMEAEKHLRTTVATLKQRRIG